ncbi:MAG: hypothetical protein PWQ37_68 [Candidatus Petromonas sp.]|jgi:benzoyl-CoA reductase/2-hydroxyglutaryl-CoA dehydratase subunit BcrC/BadD/HgdB|nr:hypothetical protein [Candidatus Petromonas sp.]
MERVGLTTTIPVEILFAAGATPVDLNNIFVTSNKGKKYIESAELEGFPRNLCSWIKGLFSVAIDNNIKQIIGVTEGDCSNTKALLEVWEMKGLKIHPFAFPQDRDIKNIKREIDNLAKNFKVSIAEVEKVKKDLHAIRKRVQYLDELTWKHNKATGFENHLYQVSCSDFNGNYNSFLAELEEKINEIEKRPTKKGEIRIGYIGVPPIFSDIYHVIEEYGGRVVYNEVQRAFTLTGFHRDTSIYEMYLDFTYPYGIDFRLKDIEKQIEIRKIDGIIHYTQAFCYRGIEDIIVKNSLNLPVLTIEGDLPGNVDARTRLRIESFIDMLKDFKI